MVILLINIFKKMMNLKNYRRVVLGRERVRRYQKKVQKEDIQKLFSVMTI